MLVGLVRGSISSPKLKARVVNQLVVVVFSHITPNPMRVHDPEPLSIGLKNKDPSGQDFAESLGSPVSLLRRCEEGRD